MNGLNFAMVFVFIWLSINKSLKELLFSKSSKFMLIRRRIFAKRNGKIWVWKSWFWKAIAKAITTQDKLKSIVKRNKASNNRANNVSKTIQINVLYDCKFSIMRGTGKKHVINALMIKLFPIVMARDSFSVGSAINLMNGFSFRYESYNDFESILIKFQLNHWIKYRRQNIAKSIHLSISNGMLSWRRKKRTKEAENGK